MQQASDALAHVFVGVVEGFQRPPRLQPAFFGEFRVKSRLVDFLQTAIRVVNENDLAGVQQTLRKNERTHHVVGDQTGHVVPLAGHGHAMQLQPQVAQPMQFQDRQIGPGGCVEADAAAGFLHLRRDGRFVRAGANEAAAVDVEMGARSAGATHVLKSATQLLTVINQ